MHHSFFPRLVNGPFDDPGLFLPFRYENRAFLFDLGDPVGLSNRDLLKVTHVFVTHTHMDHFIGFDRMLRLLLGREKRVHLFGPEGFIENVRGKLAGYTWNLVESYTNRFVIQATEVTPGCRVTSTFSCSNRFRDRDGPREREFDGTLVREPSLTVSAVPLDHGLPSLGFSLHERFHVNILKEHLSDIGAAPGPWLSGFKAAIYENAPPETMIRIPDGKGGIVGSFTLQELTGKIAQIRPGQKITYISDVAWSRENRDKIVSFAMDSDHLFIEAAFLEEEKEVARAKGHLTARQAGSLARLSRARKLSVFHFSPRYAGQENRFYEQAEDAFRSG